MRDATRRDFLKAAAASLAWASVHSSIIDAQETTPGGLPTRPLGRSKEKVSIVGIGGYHIALPPEEESIRLMHEAIDQGVTFFDNAWDYHNGRSEEVMGKALATGGRRNKIFLMTKACDRDYAGCMKHLEDSLRRLRTDHLDLWQFHEVNWPDAPDMIFEKGGIKAALEAQKAGKVRMIGFTGHKDIDHHLKMLSKSFAWDTCQMPINILDAHYRSFQKEVAPKCLEQGISVIGMKGLASGLVARKLGLSASACRRYALSLPISTLVCGITSREELLQDIAVARDFKPMTPDEVNKMLAETRESGARGEFERYKSTTDYNGVYHRKQHGDA